MLVYYELTDIRGTSNSYLVTSPSEELNTNVQDLLINECMVTQVAELYHNHNNLNAYLENLLLNVENESMKEILHDHQKHIEKFLAELRPIISAEIEELAGNESKHRETKTKSWKKDLSYARSLQTMTGYMLNFYAPVQNLSSKLGYANLNLIIGHMHDYTEQFHASITRISLSFMKNKFIN